MRVGEPITYVDTVRGGWRPGKAHAYRKGLSRSRVERTWEGHTACDQFIVERNASPFFLVKDEGVCWVRGHHTEKSEVGQALLSAYALWWSVAA